LINGKLIRLIIMVVKIYIKINLYKPDIRIYLFELIKFYND